MEFTEFSYLDATPYDTPILDRDTREKIQEKIDSYFIDDRLERAIIFRTYLNKLWNESNLRPAYFDWTTSLGSGQQSFEHAQRAIERNEREQESRSDPRRR